MENFAEDFEKREKSVNTFGRKSLVQYLEIEN
jgi:hypothetical protein